MELQIEIDKARLVRRCRNSISIELTDIEPRHIVQSVELSDVVSESRFFAPSANRFNFLCVDLLLVVSDNLYACSVMNELKWIWRLLPTSITFYSDLYATKYHLLAPSEVDA
jgi:hypothetical protein